MSKKKSGSTPSFGDPYELLGVEPGTSDADIAKAYRKLARKLHPDKQQNKSTEEKDRVAKLFHDTKEARAFLLEPEHAEERQQYDLRRASEKLRREEDAKRESRMSEQRKAMRDKLAKQEESLRRKGQTSVQTEKDLLERLKREGIAKREQHAERAARQQAKDLRAQASAREERQIRLKWSRKRVKTSPSEHSVASLLSRFGRVEHVEIIGAKGNEALVTFEDRSSCSPCVDFYETSEEMRAKFVGKRKNQEEELRRKRSPSPPPMPDRDGENLQDRKLRQAAEREMLLRHMEAEERGESIPTVKEQTKEETDKSVQSRKRMSKFPPQFPADPEYQNLSPLAQLEKFEVAVLGGLVSHDVLKRAQLTSR